MLASPCFVLRMPMFAYVRNDFATVTYYDTTIL